MASTLVLFYLQKSLTLPKPFTSASFFAIIGTVFTQDLHGRLAHLARALD